MTFVTVTCQEIKATRASLCRRLSPAGARLRSAQGATADANLAAIELTCAAVHEALYPAADVSQIVARVVRRMGVQNNNLSQFYLFQSTVTAYLGYLQSSGQARLELREASAVWIGV